MPITLPNLDDRTFDDLLEEALTLIPVHAPEWTNHNESDPGITLIQLFAYLTEMLIYRQNRVSDANVCAFLKLMDGVERTPCQNKLGCVKRVRNGKVETINGVEVERSLADEVRGAVLDLRTQDRAVTCEDFERLALAIPQVKRARCVPQRDLTKDTPVDRDRKADAHVSVVIAPVTTPFDSVLLFDGKAFTDVTGASAGGGAKIPLAPAKEASPLLYVGSDAPFESLRFVLEESGEGYALAFEYFDGQQESWVQLTDKAYGLTDSTSDLRSSGLVTFKPPPGWTPTVVNETNRYWLRVSTSGAATKVATAGWIVRDLVESVAAYLAPRRLLTTRVRVAGPRYLRVAVHFALHLKPDAMQEAVRREAEKSLADYFDPFGGGPDGGGWPFGRNVYVSEVYALLDRVPGVDYVTSVLDTEAGKPLKDENDQPAPPELTVIPEDPTRRILLADGKTLEGIRLEAGELVAFTLAESQLQLMDPKLDISRPVLDDLRKRQQS